ncbi:hypothetical protein EDB19DRAFT_1678349 [Suillus lakei]|nr:hypothetical protein EDB19DRAFT_1678349 [Suillus lakei]
MSTLGAVMSGGGGILEELQDEVAVVSFLQHASCSPGVWHTLSCSSPEAPKILSRLFKKNGTPADSVIWTRAQIIYAPDSPSVFSSGYDRAYAFRRLCGMAGPTTNPFSEAYYRLTATIIQRLDAVILTTPPEPYSSQPRERPKARLVRKMPEAHSNLLMLKMKMLLTTLGYELSPGGETVSKCIHDMVIVGTLAWFGKHRRNWLDFMLDDLLPDVHLELFEDEKAPGVYT